MKMSGRLRNSFIGVGILSLLLLSCFDQPGISVPRFIPKTPPDSLLERGIDAHPDNAIYLEWEEPATAEEEGILGYYVYRGKLNGDEYSFKRIATVNRNAGLLYKSNEYIDNGANLDTTYYYYLRSYNDFTVSKENSDTVYYRLARKASPHSPSGDISDQKPHLVFQYPIRVVDRISYLYLRLYYMESGSYQIKYFTKTHRFDLSQSIFNVYLQNNTYHTTVLLDSLKTDGSGNKYLEKGNYRWRVDAVSGEPGGGPETEGSESNWMYFTVK
ncbi:MAG: hypothetical protein RBT43_00490 [bacterium]|jgi:hypothetical protein|nr:hypothetical protein [bacterium]